MQRSYYSGNLLEFLSADKSDILNTIRSNDTFDPDTKQEKAWEEQIIILQNQLGELESGHIMFEYTIPRMGKRVDTVLIYSNFVFIMEFKMKGTYKKKDEDQCVNYALDLKHFHEASHCASIVPMLIATKAGTADGITMKKCDDGIYNITCTNKEEIIKVIRNMHDETPDCSVMAPDWEGSPYQPTPTITEAAIALCSNIAGLENITRSDAGARNLGVTTDTINDIIRKSKENKTKSICFVTGVPGSGKTLAALNLVCERINRADERAILLSGNEALVDVLRESLRKGGKCMEKYGGAAATALIQHIPKFRESIADGRKPPERIIVFDEAQRAWSAEKLSRMGRSRGQNYHNRSDPDLLISAMNLHDDWAVIVCLIGEGQEIYDGEVGLSGWLASISTRYPDWRVYYPSEMEDSIHLGSDTANLPDNIVHESRPGLHLSTSIRSFRGERLADLVREILDCHVDGAQRIWSELKNQYPIVITRSLESAKRWVRQQARGTERYGIVASSGADRLAPHGIYVRSSIKPTKWFLADQNDIRSSYYLEAAATEFYIQGLELDWVCLAWDANLRYTDGGWSHHKFHGRDWRTIKPEKSRRHLINSYRVLMTRARQGMVIFVPDGDGNDATRRSEFYDGTYDYLKKIGFEEI